jgi:hypothetical protein
LLYCPMLIWQQLHVPPTLDQNFPAERQYKKHHAHSANPGLGQEVIDR